MKTSTFVGFVLVILGIFTCLYGSILYSGSEPLLPAAGEAAGGSPGGLLASIFFGGISLAVGVWLVVKGRKSIYKL